MDLRFDRGTLILEAPSSTPVPDGLVWDPRVAAFRAEAHRLAELGVRIPDTCPDPGRRPDSLTLRPYQEAALAAWRGAGGRGLIVLPTGAGKTHVAIAAIVDSGLPALCLVPTRVLLHQWVAELSRHLPHPVGCLGDGVRALQRVTVATFESALRWMPRIGGRFALLVVDEAHHFASQRVEALEMSPATLRLGLTATPPEEPARARLGSLLGPVVYQLAVSDLAGTWLAPCEFVTWTLPLTLDERAAYDSLRARFDAVHYAYRACGGEGSFRDFMAVAQKTLEGRRAVFAWRRARAVLAHATAKQRAVAELLGRHADAPVLIFTADNASTYALARELLVAPITCDIGRAEREAVLAAFRAGELRALVSAQVLNEGLDVPDAEVGIILGGRMGTREHVQRVGRLLRPRPGKRAIVYELVAAGTEEVRQARRRRDGLAARCAAPL